MFVKHEIQLVFANKRVGCMDGSPIRPQEIAVTCSCLREGDRVYIGPVFGEKAIAQAWAKWNQPTYHIGDGFIPNDYMAKRHGVEQPE